MTSDLWHGSPVTEQSLVAGVDTSTQSVKVVVREADTGAWVREGRASHPDGTEVAPEEWWTAFGEACSGGLLDGVSAISIAGQQHGMVALDESGDVVRPALLWNDTRSAPDASDLVTELGGPAMWADAVGSVPVAAFTPPKRARRAACGTRNRSNEISALSSPSSAVLGGLWLSFTPASGVGRAPSPPGPAAPASAICAQNR